VGIQGPLLLGPLRSFHSSIRSHRQAREAHRTGTPAENLTVLPETLRHAFDAIAAESVLSLRFPVAFGWTPPPLAPLTLALVLATLGLLATCAGVSHEELSGAVPDNGGPLAPHADCAVAVDAARPVVRESRRARIEARPEG